MAAFGSSNSATGTGSAVVTKPTSLTAGDLLIAFVADASSGSVPTTPANWSLVKSHTSPFDEHLYVFAKIADASDAAASNFTFSHGNGSEPIVAHLLRITGTFSSPGNIYLQASNDATIETANTVLRFANGFTPTVENSLLVMSVVGLAEDSFDDSNASAYALQNNNPTWSEKHDDLFAVDYRLSTATATRTETTATGYYQAAFTLLGGEVLFRGWGILLAITDTTNASPTLNPISSSLNIQAPSPAADANIPAPAVLSFGASALSSTPSISDPLWKNADKPSPGPFSNIPKP